MEEVRLVFNETGALVAFFGALGGSVRAAVLRTTWVEALRVVFVGGATAFGAGVMTLTALRPLIGIPEDLAVSTGTRCSAAFLLGLVAVTWVERLIDRHRQDANERTGR